MTRDSPERPPHPRANPRLARYEPIQHETPAFSLMELQDAVDRGLRNDGIRVDETEHTRGAGRDAGIARPGARAANGRRQSHASFINESSHDLRGSILASIVRHHHFERCIGQPEPVPRNARESRDAHEDRFERLADQHLLVSRGYHEGETMTL